MRKGLFAAVCAALGVALATTATVGAQGQGQGQGQTPAAQDRTIVLYESDERGTFRFVDSKPFTRLTRRGPRRISAGDRILIRNPTYTDQALTQRSGALLANCTAQNGSRRFDRVTFLCDGIYTLPDGTITASGLFKPGEGQVLITLAVTGGTGAYEGARGQITINDPEGNNPSTDTIRLLGDK